MGLTAIQKQVEVIQHQKHFFALGKPFIELLLDFVGQECLHVLVSHIYAIDQTKRRLRGFFGHLGSMRCGDC